jgi:hydrogenase small subunit
VSSKVVEYPAIWIAGAACSGCSVSLLNAINPSIQNVLVDPVLPGKHVSLKFHATVMAGQGEAVVKVMKDTSTKKPKGYLLIVDGSIPTGEDGLYCRIGELDGRELTMMEMTAELARDALAVLAVGTCAAFGGIPSGAPNPTGAKAVSDFFKEQGIKTPLINVSGCPPHPDWMLGTIADVLLNGLPSPDALDEKLRPKAFFGTGVSLRNRMQRPVHVCGLPDQTVEQRRELVHRLGRAVHRLRRARLSRQTCAHVREDR